MLVSNKSGRRSSTQSSDDQVVAGEQEPVLVPRDLSGQPAGLRAGADQGEQRVG